MADRMTRDTLIENMEMGRLELDGLLAWISDEQMVEQALPGGWSVKDVLAHIATWEERFAGWLEAMQRGEAPDIPAGGFTSEVVDRSNVRIYEENRSRPLEAVREAYRASLGRVLAALEKTSEDDLNAPYVKDLPSPLWRLAAESTYEHYEEHGADIRAWLGLD